MAKKKMLCPFSDRACKNCSLYIGRHYLLCDKSGYRGYLPGGSGKNTSPPKHRSLEVPELEYIEELDPYLELQ